MRVIYVEPMEYAEIRDIEPGLDSFRKIVGGTIQAVYPFDDPVALICNDEGKLLGLPLNRGLSDKKEKLYDIIAGTFIICLAIPESDEYEGLTDELANKYLKKFLFPEIFMRQKDGDIINIKGLV